MWTANAVVQAGPVPASFKNRSLTTSWPPGAKWAQTLFTNAAFVDAWCEDYGLAPMVEPRVALCRIESSAALADQLVAALSDRRVAA